jgi:ATP phosphoribosyltransferase regulatory subunit
MRAEPATPADVLAAIRAPLATGAQAADAPIVQPLSLLLDLAGEAMRARLFVVQAEGGEEMCLRPDFTVAVAGNHIAGGAAAGRYVYEGPAFRSSPGGDRPEQFVQLGLEVFSSGAGSPAAEDVEIASLAWRASLAGGRSDLTLWLGDVGLFGAFIESLGLPEALGARLRRAAGRPRLMQAELARAGQARPPADNGQLADVLAGLSERDAATLLEELWALAGVTPVGGRGPQEIAQRLIRRAEAAKAPALSEGQAEAIRRFLAISDTPAAALARIRTLGGGAPALAVALEAWSGRLDALARDIDLDAARFAPALGHAFDYYDGLTFEVRSAALGEGQPVAVGGRYDGLLVRLGAAVDTRAVGCMVRPWRAFSGGGA